MNRKVMFFLACQFLPVLMLGMTLLGAVGDLTYAYHEMGMKENPYLTEYQRSPERFWTRIWDGVEWAGFLFVLGLPSQLIILWWYDQDQMEKKKREHQLQRPKDAVPVP